MRKKRALIYSEWNIHSYCTKNHLSGQLDKWNVRALVIMWSINYMA